MSPLPIPIRLGRHGGTTDADFHAASCFVFARPGWCLEERTTARAETYLTLSTHPLDVGGQQHWRVVRTEQGLLVSDEVTGRQLGTSPTMQGVLASLWETATTSVLS